MWWIATLRGRGKTSSWCFSGTCCKFYIFPNFLMILRESHNGTLNNTLPIASIYAPSSFLVSRHPPPRDPSTHHGLSFLLTILNLSRCRFYGCSTSPIVAEVHYELSISGNLGSTGNTVTHRRWPGIVGSNSSNGSLRCFIVLGKAINRSCGIVTWPISWKDNM